MICPNLKNPQVAQEFNELVSAVGERAAYDIWNQNNGNSIDLAPNGAKSKLFSDLLSYFNNDRPSAIQAKAKVFSNEFKTWFGDWTDQKETILGDKESNNFEIVDLSPNYDDGGESSVFTVRYKKDIKKDIPLKDRKAKVSQEYDYLQKLRDNDIKKVNDLTEDKVELTEDGNLHIKDTAITIYIKRLGLNSLSEYKEYEINKIISEKSDDILLKQAESNIPQYEESSPFINVIVDTDTGQLSGNIGSVAIELPEQLRGKGFGKELYLLLNKYLYNTKNITLKSDPLGVSESAHRVWESFRKDGKATLLSGNPNDFENGFYTAKYELNPPQQTITNISKTDASARLVTYLEQMIASGDKYGKLAKILLESDLVPYNLKYFRVDNNRDDVEYTGGSYVTGPNLTLIEVLGNKSSESSINRAILHELLHSNTDKLLEDYKKDPNSVSKEQRTNIKELYDIINYAKDYLLKNYDEKNFIEILNRQSKPVNSTLFYAFNKQGVNEIDEFISELFTNPGFQEVLNNIPYKESNISLWDKIVEAISNIFGFKINKNSVLEGALHYSTNLITNNKQLNVSKAVDENGEPELVWHHSPSKDIYEFKIPTVKADEFFNGLPTGVFFSSDKKYSNVFGESSYPCFLSIKNPVYSNEISSERVADFRNIDEFASVDTGIKPSDGMIGHDVQTMVTISGGIEYVVFSPNQIKSAIKNTGEFDVNTENIFRKNTEKLTRLNTQASETYRSADKYTTTFKGNESATSTDVLTNLLNDGVIPTRYTSLVNQLLNTTVPIDIVDSLSLNDYMRLDAKSKKIGITTRAFIDKTSKTEFAEAIIHELVHYHTIDAYENNSKFRKLVDKYFAKARKYFKDQADLLDANKDYDIETFYGLTNQYEFISEIMTNPKFREALARKDTPTWKQLLIGIVNAIFKTDIKVYNNNAKIIHSIIEATNNIIVSNGANFVMADREVEEDFNKKVSFKDSFNEYYDNVREDKAILQQASMTIKTMHEGLTSNIKSLSREKHGGTKKEELERLKQRLSELEDKQAMLEFLYTIDDKLQQPYMFVAGKYRDLLDTETMADSDKYEALMNSMPDHRLMQLQHDVVGFYGPMINRINELFLAGYFKDLYEEQTRTRVLDEKVLKFEQAITRAVDSYAKLDAQFKSLIRAKAQYNLKKLGLEYGSPTIDSYVGNKLLSMVGDISAIERSILSPKASSDEAARLLHRSLVDANTRVSWAFDSKGKQLMALQSKARNPQELYEVDENGKRTGYLIRPRNYGMFKRDYKTFINELNDKYGIVDNNLLSLPHEELIKYRKEKNDWLSEHAERRYTKEYYNLYNNLSANTEMKLKDVQNKIASVLSSVMSDDRKPELERLSDKDWFILRDLWREKKSLASQFYLDGTMKSGDDLDSAIELSDVNKMLNKNLKYKANIDKFNEVLSKKEQQYKDRPDLLRKWKERNTKLEYDQEFWDKLSQIESADRGEYYKKLNEAKSSIISVYRENNFQPEIEDNSIRNTIRSLDKEMARVRGSIKVRKAAGSIAFSHIAEIEKTDRYYLDKQKALNDDKLVPGMYKIWQDSNHYTDERGVLTPYSYYTYIKPKDEKYIKVMPSAAFQEIDPSSPFFNENYDDNIDDKVQPKKSLYDNSTAYEKAMSHGGNANLYNGLLETMQQSQAKIPFLNNRDSYFLPQVTGTMYRHVASSGLKGVGQYVADKIAVKNDDVEYAIDEVLMRADKSKLRFIPTHYVTPLDNPENISSDITGITADFFRMAANYDEMSKLAPTFEVILSALGNRSVRMKNLMSRKEYEVSGKETNLYKQIEEMMSANLYGELTKELGVVKSRQDKPGEIKVSISKILGGFGKWSSITMLGWNTTSLLAGLGTAKVQTAAEMLSNRFFGSTDYAKADFEVTKNLPGMISNFGANKTTNKLLCLLEHFGVVFSDEEKFAYTNRSRVQRVGKALIDPMTPWTVVDMTIKTPVMTAVLFNHKLVTTTDENGDEIKEFMPRRKFIRQYLETPLKEGEQKHTRKEAKRLWNMMSETLYDAYTIDKDGIVGLKDKYREYVTPNLEYSVRNTIMTLTAKLDGVLNQTDKTALQRQAFVKLIFMFRGFLVSNLEDRLLKKKQWNYMIEDWDEAQYRAALKGIWSYLKYSYTYAKDKFKKAENNKINVPYHEREALRKTMSEAGITLAIYVAAMMIKPLADKDKRNYWMNLLLYLCDRVGLEMRAAYTGVDLLNMLKSVSAVNTMVDNIIVIGSALFPDVDLTGMHKTKQKLVTKGAYKGMSQWEKSAIKLTPFKNIIEAPYVRDKDKYLRGQLSKQN